MSLLYSRHEDWTYGVECELPYKVCFKLDEKPSSITFLEVKRGDDTKVCLFADMGDDQRTVEMITEPIRIGQEQERVNNFKIMAFLEYMLKQCGGESIGEGGIVRRNMVETAFSRYVGLPGNEALKDYKIKLLTSEAYIYKDIGGGNQISFGMPFRDMKFFFEEYDNSDLWWKSDQYKCGELSDPLDREIYNYIMCAIFKLAEVKLSNEDITCPAAKNAWEVMPRIAPTALLKEGQRSVNIKGKIRKAIEDISKKAEPDKEKFNEALQWAWEYLIVYKGVIGGHVGTIRKTLKDEDMLMVFEVRSPGACFAEYFAYKTYALPEGF